MMTHTLGPWTVDDNYIMCRYDGNGNYICRMLGRGEETDANARLIAAAPDLLAALNTAVQAFNNLVEFGLLRGDEYEHETMLIIEKLEDVIKEATQP